MTLQALEAVCKLWQYAGLTNEFSIKYPNFFSYSLAFNQIIVFSFMGDFRGRVIHAYFDGTDIIVKKTNLYHFYPVEKARKMFELSLRRMEVRLLATSKHSLKTFCAEAHRPQLL